jgi:hypothetical protein
MYTIPICGGLLVLVWIYYIRLQKFKNYKLKFIDKVIFVFVALIFIACFVYEYVKSMSN